MKSWAGMSAAGRAGVVAAVAAVIAALFWGAWQVRGVPEGEVVATGSGAASGEGAEAAAAADGGEQAAVTEGAGEGEASGEAGAADQAEGEAAPAGEVTAEAEPAGEAAGEAVAAEEGAAEAAPEAVVAEEEVAAEAPAAEEAAAPVEELAAAEPLAEAAPAVVAPQPPSFDLVRVERDGSALVAGKAAASSMLSLRVTGAEIAAVPADGAGNFVAMFNLAPSNAPRVLSLVMRLADGTEVAAEGSVVIAPTVAPEVVAVAEPAAEATGEAVAETAPAVEAAPAALLVTDEGAKVLQSAEALPAELVANVTIDTITYTPEGAVQLAGRGTAERVVRVYLDNAQVGGDVAISSAGDWAVTLPEVAAGIYTLRADQIGADGAVTSRFETPFKRETVEALAAASGAEGAAAGEAAAEPVAEAEVVDAPEAAAEGPLTVTVQPGFTLWRIATENLGEGVRYVQVFEANREQIRDPDLIYPGQVFTIPQE